MTVKKFNLKNDEIEVKFIPELGGRVSSLVNKRTGKEWVWKDPRLSTRKVEEGQDYDDNWQGGWEELFPNDAIENFSWGPGFDHGELWFKSWDLLNLSENNATLEIKNLDVNDKWNWKPGAYKTIREYLSNKLQINKKCQSLTKLIDRTRDNINYTNYLFRQIREMEMEKGALKRLGVLKNVDIEEFKEKCIEFVKRVEEQCLKASEMTKGNVTINTFVSDLETRLPKIYYSIMLIIPDLFVRELRFKKFFFILCQISFLKLIQQ